MKKIYFLFFLLAGFYAGAQQTYLLPRVNYVSGQGVQHGKFDAVGLGLQYEKYSSVDARFGLIASAEAHLSGVETKRVDLNFGGSNGYTNVDYSSSMNKVTVGGIVVPMNGKLISPFVSVQGGVMWYRTKFMINDPTNSDFCSPVHSRNVKISFGLVGNVESGLKVRLRNKPGKEMFAQAGIGYSFGTKASYIKLGDEPDDANTVAYNSKFRMSNGDTHEHCIGTLYRTNISQLVYSVGVSFVFGD